MNKHIENLKLLRVALKQENIDGMDILRARKAVDDLLIELKNKEKVQSLLKKASLLLNV